MLSNKISFFITILTVASLKRHVCQLQSKVVGGEFIKISQAPHSVFIDMECIKENSICGSSILTHKILLTAAHCTEDCNFAALTDGVNVFAGHEDYTRSPVLRKVKKTFPHHKYYKSKNLHDISLMLLDKELPFSSNIKRVILAKSFPKAVSGVVSGWGSINEDQHLDIRLKSITQNIIPRTDCGNAVKLPKTSFCAGTFKKHASYPYTGDSGSGMVTRNHEIMGIISFRYDMYKALVMYTNVTLYYDWIQKTVKHLYCD